MNRCAPGVEAVGTGRHSQLAGRAHPLGPELEDGMLPTLAGGAARVTGETVLAG